MEKINYRWFKKNIKVGGSINPLQMSRFIDFDVVISVDSNYSVEVHDLFTKNNVKYYWFPMNECSSDMGINSIYAVMKILYMCEMHDYKVYLHCAVGANRSPTVNECYYFMRTGKYQSDELIKCNPEIQKMFVGYENQTHYIQKNKLLQNIEDGFLPPKHKMEMFLSEMNKQLESNTVDLEELKIIASIL